MNKFFKTLIYILTASLLSFSYGQEAVKFTYADNFSNSTRTRRIAPILPKKNRVNSNAGTISITVEDAIPDSISICIATAIDIWESYIGSESLVHLKFCYTDQLLDNANDIEIEVGYYTPNNGTYYPSSLYHNIFTNREVSDESPDAIIRINNLKSWDCSYSGTSVGRQNLTYAMLRAIAISLGFGSSITQKTIRGRDIITFAINSGYSIFDNLIFSSAGKQLNSISNIGTRENTALNNFVQPTNGCCIYALKADESHKLYAPESFQPYKSLIYLDNSNSLMHYDLGIDDRQLQIDSVTVDLLKAIGWNICSEKEIQIVGVGIDDNGITSAYDSHQFQIQNNTAYPLTDIQWKFTLPAANGGDITICQKSDSPTFDIPAIDDESQYKININGDIYGKISLTGTLNGKSVSDTYRISLELKPKIKAVNILQKESDGPDFYNLSYTVEYVGADYLTIILEEEWSTSLYYSYVYEPFFAHITTEHILSMCWAWIDIVARNEYGKDTYTIELEPFDVGTNPSDVHKETTKNFTHIMVYNAAGINILKTENENGLSRLSKGLYILAYYKGNQLIKTTKYIK